MPGDLVFFEPGDPSGAGHVGIYSGNGQMIDAPHKGAVVREEGVWWDEFIQGGRKYPQNRRNGGQIFGAPGESVPVRAHAGEFFFSPEATAALGAHNLRALNDIASGVGLHGGRNSRVSNVRMPEQAGGARFNLQLVLDGKTVHKSVEIHSRDARVVMSGRN